LNNEENIDDDNENEEDEFDAKSLDDSVRKTCNIDLNIDLSFTQESILKFPEYFDRGEPSNAR
jgi:hypothetical protein